MATYKVLKSFREISAGKTHAIGDELKLTVARANEIEENLKPWGGGFLERIDKDKKDDA
ncbi:Uncharacterised protein [Lysinibacillus capsici]|uniref:Uncharacterized protein n=1 Tax=Lysinibacillus capsici TaxID=2115968 RepID=A0A2X0XH71_9BACI|nr:hypothetical protein [Lysinibacillus capsici]SPT98414.1 Uncharacterised protein [Lysinibacillus capsici]